MNLAGFDIVAELSIDTVSDFANSQPVPLPDGTSVYIFGGKFSLNVPLSVPILGNGMAGVFCQASLGSVPGTSACALILEFSDGGLTFGPLSVRHVAATATIAVSAGIVPDPTKNAPPNGVVPTIQTAFAVAKVNFDAATASAIDGTFGAGKSALVAAALSDALQAWVRSQPIPLGSRLPFTVAPGQDSTSPTQLSAIPEICWVDPFTLGIFGYYRAAATGGNLGQKTDSDIVQTGPEFVYVTDELFSVIPARRVAVLMSASGFHQTVACPMIKTQVIRGLVYQEKEDEYIAQVRAELGTQFYSQEAGKSLIAYFSDEETKHPTDLPGDFQRAKDRVQADADNDIRNEAANRLNAWLDSPDGQLAISNSVPPSCGNGSVEANRQHMPDPFSDVVSTLRELDIDLQDGYVSFLAKADGNLPVCGGFSVTQTAQVKLTVDSTQNRVFPSIHNDPTQVDISVNPFCKVAASILVDLFTGVTWGTATVFIGAAIAELIGQNIVANIIEERIQGAKSGLGAVPVPLPANSRLLDVQIEPIGIRTVALLGRDIDHYNNFLPGLKVVATQLSRTQWAQASSGTMTVPADPAGCAAATFNYCEQKYDTAFRVALSAVDLPLPVEVISWQLQIGNFLYTSLGPTINDIKLPGPYWTGSLVNIAAPTTTLEGDIWHPAPPLDGQFERKNVLVQASGSSASGWRLTFSGADGCFYVQVTVTAEDGDGRTWTGSTFLTINGEAIFLGQDYQNYKAACDAKKSALLLAELGNLRQHVIVGHVAPGAPVEGQLAVVSGSIRQAIQARDRNAYTALYSAVRSLGPSVLRAFASGSKIADPGRNSPR